MGTHTHLRGRPDWLRLMQDCYNTMTENKEQQNLIHSKYKIKFLQNQKLQYVSIQSTNINILYK